MVKTNVKIYPKVVLEFDFKLSVEFLFVLSIYGEHMFIIILASFLSFNIIRIHTDIAAILCVLNLVRNLIVAFCRVLNWDYILINSRYRLDLTISNKALPSRS